MSDNRLYTESTTYERNEKLKLKKQNIVDLKNEFIQKENKRFPINF